MAACSRSNRPSSFFKFMIGDFTKQLRIPPAFVNKLGGLKRSFPQEILLWNFSNGRWSVEVNKSDNNIYLRDGWKEFAEDNSLKIGDFLVFYYYGGQELHVRIWGKSCCEKEGGIPHETRESREAPRRDATEIIELDPNGESEDTLEDAWDAMSEEEDDESEESDKMANKEILGCVGHLRQSYTRNGKMLMPRIFKKFVVKNQIVKLQSANGRGTGTARVLVSHGNYMFGSGWSKFERANNFQPGDILNFRMIDDKDVTFEVSHLK